MKKIKRMKNILSILLITMYISAIVVMASPMPNSKLHLGAWEVELEYPMIEKDDRLYISIRELGELMNIPVYWDADTGGVNFDIDHKKVPYSGDTKIVEEGMIQDKETAIAVGRAILESLTGRKMEYEDGDFTYFLQAYYNEKFNMWSVSQGARYKGYVFYAASYVLGPTIRIDKATGEVVSIEIDKKIEDIVEEYKRDQLKNQ